MMSRRIRSAPLVVLVWVGTIVVVARGGGGETTASSSSSSTLHTKRRLHFNRFATNNISRNRRREELRRTNRVDNDHKLYFSHRALRNGGTMMSMGHHDNEHGAYPGLLDYFTDDQDVDDDATIDDNFVSMDAQAGDGGGGGESGISSASFNSTNDEQTPVQEEEEEEEGSNDLMEIALESVGDDDEIVVPVIEENGIDINGTEGTSSVVDSSSAVNSSNNNTASKNNSTSVNNNNSSNSNSNSTHAAGTTTSSITGSGASNSDSDTSNSSSGISDSTSTDSSSAAVTGSNASTSNSDNDSSNSSGGISDSTSVDSSSTTVSNVSTSNSDSDSSNSSGGISDSTTIDSSSDSTSNSSSGISDSTSIDSSSAAVTGSDTTTSNSDNGGSSTTSDTDDTSSTSGNSTIPLTLEQRKSIIESKCQLSIHARSQALINLIGSFVSSPELTIITQVGPQYEAFVWLVHFDDAILCPPSSNDNEMAQRIVQRYTLAALYYAMNGDEWTNCSSSRKLFDTASTNEIGTCNNAVRFLDASHECNWYGISCVGDAEKYEVDSYYAIDEIVLPDNNLSGAIPTEFYKAFDKLRVWNMAKNQGVIGTLSNGVGRFTELEVLILNENDLEGAVPFEALLKLQRLETINLGDNSMSGNATLFCNGLSSTSHQLDTFISDCASSVTCPCCTSCA